MPQPGGGDKTAALKRRHKKVQLPCSPRVRGGAAKQKARLGSLWSHCPRTCAQEAPITRPVPGTRSGTWPLRRRTAGTSCRKCNTALHSSHHIVIVVPMDETQDTAASRMLAILEALAFDNEGPSGLTVTALARALGRDKSSVSRQLRPLVELGMVERDEEGFHRLGWRLFAIAAKAGDQRLLLLTPPVMRELARKMGERVHLSIRRNDEVLTILSEGPRRAVEAVGWVGRTVPVAYTSSGRALLFDHSAEEIRALVAEDFRRGPGSKAPKTSEEVVERVTQARMLGYAVVVDEFEDGLAGVAAPVRDIHGRIVAALNLSAPTYRLGEKNLQSAGRQISQAALYVSRALSSPPASPLVQHKEQHDARELPDADVRRIS